jgi:hypothetical protein
MDSVVFPIAAAGTDFWLFPGGFWDVAAPATFFPAGGVITQITLPHSAGLNTQTVRIYDAVDRATGKPLRGAGLKELEISGTITGAVRGQESPYGTAVAGVTFDVTNQMWVGQRGTGDANFENVFDMNVRCTYGMVIHFNTQALGGAGGQIAVTWIPYQYGRQRAFRQPSFGYATPVT